MATVNRYTQTKNSVYQPRTLQELMVAPAYKRQKHDELDAGIAQYETQLAQTDALDVHSEALQKEQKRLYDRMLAQRDKLEAEGFSQSSKSDFIRFNKDYQQAIGPQGTIGKIDKARISYETEKENLLKNATAMGYGPEKVQEKLAKKYEQYKEDYLKSGRITAFEAPLPPKYEDLQKDILEIGKAMGSETLTKLKQNGYEIGIEGGLYVIKTQSGKVIETSNDPNIQNAITYLNDKWVNKDGTGAQSAEWQGLTPDTIQSQINSGLGLQRQYKNIDQRKDSYQFMTIPQAKLDADNKPLNFIRNKIPGFNTSSIAPNSPLLALDKVMNLEFDKDTGDIVDVAKGQSYDQMVNNMKAEAGVGVTFFFNEEDGLHYMNTPYQTKPSPILKQGTQIKADLIDIKKDNPLLANLSDKELIERLQAFKENLASNYVTDVQVPGQTFEWYSDDLFGNTKGSGENSAGTVVGKHITMNGKQLTYDMVLNELGHESVADFKNAGNPTINGYVPALGKFKGTVYDKDGIPQNIFVEAPKEVQRATEMTQKAATAMMSGKAFTKLDIADAPEGHAFYLINDFDNEPIIVLSSNQRAASATDLISPIETIAGTQFNKINPEDKFLPYSEVYRAEENALGSNIAYRDLLGLDKTSK
jgi:hypothetical protein